MVFRIFRANQTTAAMKANWLGGFPSCTIVFESKREIVSWPHLFGLGRSNLQRWLPGGGRELGEKPENVTLSGRVGEGRKLN